MASFAVGGNGRDLEHLSPLGSKGDATGFMNLNLDVDASPPFLQQSYSTPSGASRCFSSMRTTPLTPAALSWCLLERSKGRDEWVDHAWTRTGRGYHPPSVGRLPAITAHQSGGACRRIPSPGDRVTSHWSHRRGCMTQQGGDHGGGRATRPPPVAQAAKTSDIGPAEREVPRVLDRGQPVIALGRGRAYVLSLLVVSPN